MLVSYEFIILYPSDQIDIKNPSPRTETTYPFKKIMNESFCSLFISGRWNVLNRSAFLTVKYHNPENLFFQHLPVKEKTKNPCKNNRLKEINRRRKSIIVDTLPSVDIVEIMKCGGIILEVFEGYLCHNLE